MALPRRRIEHGELQWTMSAGQDQRTPGTLTAASHRAVRSASAAAVGLPGETAPRIVGESETSGTLGTLSYSHRSDPVGGPGESSEAHGSALRM